MSRFIYNVRYINMKRGGKRAITKLCGLLEYVGTREGVEKIPRPYFKNPNAPATQKQVDKLTELIAAYPDSTQLFEYEDYTASPTMENASLLLEAIIDNNFAEAFDTSEYMDYIAFRPGAERLSGTNGLFTTGSSNINMSEAKREIAEANGNVYTTVLSLRREDAARLCYDNAAIWQSTIKANLPTIAAQYKIPLSNLHWYAAFHNESHHPHCHMILWSDGKETFLSEKGIEKIKSAFVTDIFRDDMFEIYAKQKEAHSIIKEEVEAAIKEGVYSPELGSALADLSLQLESYSGRDFYQYLPVQLKATVDNALDKLSNIPVIKTAYSKYTLAKSQQVSFYKSIEDQPPVTSLKDNPDFRDIKNMIIRAARNIDLDNLSVGQVVPPINGEDTSQVGQVVPLEWENENTADVEEALSGVTDGRTVPDENEFLLSIKKREEVGQVVPLENKYIFAASLGSKIACLWLGKCYLYGSEDNGILKDYEQAADYLHKAYSLGNVNAALYLGRLYSNQEFIFADPYKAEQFYTIAAEAGNPYGEYGLGCLYLYGAPNFDRDYEKAVSYLTAAAEHGCLNATQTLDRFKEQAQERAVESSIALVKNVSRLLGTGGGDHLPTATNAPKGIEDIKEKIKRGEKISNDIKL